MAQKPDDNGIGEKLKTEVKENTGKGNQGDKNLGNQLGDAEQSKHNPHQNKPGEIENRLHGGPKM